MKLGGADKQRLHKMTVKTEIRHQKLNRSWKKVTLETEKKNIQHNKKRYRSSYSFSRLLTVNNFDILHKARFKLSLKHWHSQQFKYSLNS